MVWKSEHVGDIDTAITAKGGGIEGEAVNVNRVVVKFYKVVQQHKSREVDCLYIPLKLQISLYVCQNMKIG